VTALIHRSFAALPSERLANGQPAALEAGFAVDAPIVLDFDASLELIRRDDGLRHYARNLRQDGLAPSWLPRGSYRVGWHCARLDLPPGRYIARIGLWDRRLGESRLRAVAEHPFSVEGEAAGKGSDGAWTLASEGPVELDRLSWRKGPTDWFYKHFDHAAPTVISYMLGDAPELRGRILDVGCGDGITDLGIALRTEPECLYGVDPFRGYERLPEILAANQLDPSVIPDCLRFLPADANHLPFDDDSFDVVLSWGSVEHIAGGYHQALLEMRRVLRDGGLLFIHPGLYYSSIGHHLGEFSPEPHVHLKHDPETLRRMVLEGTPNYIDRAGEFASPAQYWQWYTELNPITVDRFEQELRMLGFEFRRAALRTDERIDYSPELQRYPLLHLGIAELYLACVLRKPARPAGFRALPLGTVEAPS
jgi:SAM-dependent methyltransferase